MTKRVVSLLRHAIGEPVHTDPRLEANAYAVMRNVDLTVVLTDCSVELAAVNAQVESHSISGIQFPASSTHCDLVGLIESGVQVVALNDSLTAAGLTPTHLVPGVNTINREELAQLIHEADTILTW
ncbi:hypothetical protein [Stomatohabitans albus]|uniref:hypothetical protein n=1 Tax=Stomatohabitans albus TaxID=3110766 RepID=UPI00300C4BAB